VVPQSPPYWYLKKLTINAHILFSAPTNVVTLCTSYMVEKRTACKLFLDGEPEEKRLHRRKRERFENNIKTDF
jgi:hypothetical protein